MVRAYFDEEKSTRTFHSFAMNRRYMPSLPRPSPVEFSVLATLFTRFRVAGDLVV
jgi:hypothetical protein